MTHLFIFVGPPRSGKTTLANLVIEGKPVYRGESNSFDKEFLSEVNSALKRGTVTAILETKRGTGTAILETNNFPSLEMLTELKQKFDKITVCSFDAVT